MQKQFQGRQLFVAIISIIVLGFLGFIVYQKYETLNNPVIAILCAVLGGYLSIYMIGENTTKVEGGGESDGIKGKININATGSYGFAACILLFWLCFSYLFFPSIKAVEMLQASVKTTIDIMRNNVDLEIQNSTTANKLLREESSNLALFPRGVILAYHLRDGVIPQGWAICNGENNTPDLRNKFIMGAASTSEVGNKEGKKDHTHSMTGTTDSARSNPDAWGWYAPENRGKTPAASGLDHSHNFTATTVATEHTPESVKILYIMKL